MSGLTQRWVQREITNFDYLMQARITPQLNGSFYEVIPPKGCFNLDATKRIPNDAKQKDPRM